MGLMQPIYRLNSWYDRLDDTHPTARFLIFIIPMMIFVGMIYFGSYRIMCAGVTSMAIMSFLRIAPIAFPPR